MKKHAFVFLAALALHLYNGQRHGVRPVIEQSFALDDVHAALDRLASGAQFGKLALAIE